MVIKLILADNQPIYIAGIKHILARATGFSLLWECATANEALNAVREFKPDVLIVHSRILRQSGMHFIREIKDKQLDSRIVVISKDLTATETVRLTRWGVSGVVHEGSAPESLIRCIGKVAAGERWIEEQIASRALDLLLEREVQQLQLAKLLTRREIEIARLAAAGMRNKEIGKKLFVDEGTVKSHLHQVFVRLQVNGRHALANLLRVTEL